MPPSIISISSVDSDTVVSECVRTPPSSNELASPDHNHRATVDGNSTHVKTRTADGTAAWITSDFPLVQVSRDLAEQYVRKAMPQIANFEALREGVETVQCTQPETGKKQKLLNEVEQVLDGLYACVHAAKDQCHIPREFAYYDRSKITGHHSHEHTEGHAKTKWTKDNVINQSRQILPECHTQPQSTVPPVQKPEHATEEIATVNFSSLTKEEKAHRLLPLLHRKGLKVPKAGAELQKKSAPFASANVKSKALSVASGQKAYEEKQFKSKKRSAVGLQTANRNPDTRTTSPEICPGDPSSQFSSLAKNFATLEGAPIWRDRFSPKLKTLEHAQRQTCSMEQLHDIVSRNIQSIAIPDTHRGDVCMNATPRKWITKPPVVITDASRYADAFSDYMDYTHHDFLESEASQILALYDGDFDYAKSLYRDLGYRGLLSLLRANRLKMATAEAEETADSDYGDGLSQEDGNAVIELCRGCLTGCDSCCPVQEEEINIRSCNCDIEYGTHSTDHCVDCSEPGLQTKPFNKIDKSTFTNAAHNMESHSNVEHLVLLECRHCGTIFCPDAADMCTGCGDASGLQSYQTAAESIPDIGSDPGKHVGVIPTHDNSTRKDYSGDLRHFGLSNKGVANRSRGGTGTGNSQSGNDNKCTRCEEKVCHCTVWEAGDNLNRHEETTPDNDSWWGVSRPSSFAGWVHDPPREPSGSDWGTQEASAPKPGISIPTSYTVTYWATIESSNQTIHVPIDSTNVCGSEKTIIDGESCGMKKIWKWVQEKGLGDKIGLQDAFDLAKDMYGEVEKTINPQDEKHAQHTSRAEHDGWNMGSLPPYVWGT
ncbi:uncharacterized protein K460DRAFT_403070 [Cucurbitaria berberidis CBS 394.84]|uniref:Uncharacterized protein n=1 Tax=Cucurbitaria berberidis CBS 394.84 TaxID=1168544 RepID=A0A9P4LB13_9PLEO|nr:uncharacterized protein K460DRAFT_403070 [Cucurbitaria berberidis CBS 394.84]KAF1847744.1 hypothetical protein K460DRAFT_403070 [Cucurbitaria berberidis CBS 394.84]